MQKHQPDKEKGNEPLAETSSRKTVEAMPMREMEGFNNNDGDAVSSAPAEYVLNENGANVCGVEADSNVAASTSKTTAVLQRARMNLAAICRKKLLGAVTPTSSSNRVSPVSTPISDAQLESSSLDNTPRNRIDLNSSQSVMSTPSSMNTELQSQETSVDRSSSSTPLLSGSYSHSEDLFDVVITIQRAYMSFSMV